MTTFLSGLPCCYYCLFRSSRDTIPRINKSTLRPDPHPWSVRLLEPWVQSAKLSLVLEHAKGRISLCFGGRNIPTCQPARRPSRRAQVVRAILYLLRDSAPAVCAVVRLTLAIALRRSPGIGLKPWNGPRCKTVLRRGVNCDYHSSQRDPKVLVRCPCHNVITSDPSDNHETESVCAANDCRRATKRICASGQHPVHCRLVMCSGRA